MISFLCPHCEKLLSVADERAGKMGRCPKCLAQVRVPATSGGVSPVARQEPEDYDDTPIVRRRRKRKDTAGAVAFGAAFGGFVAAGMGLILSQYAPVFGNLFVMWLTEPWSTGRVSLIPMHVGVLGLLGAAGGGLAARYWASNGVKVVALLVGFVFVVSTVVYASVMELERRAKAEEREGRSSRNR